MKTVLAPLTLAAALVLTGCAGAGSAPNDAAETQAVEEGPQALELVGAWKQTNSASEDSYQQATVTTDTITVEWVADGGTTTSIYWVGTFEAPSDASEPFTWVSQRDAAATDSALLASSDDTKEFTFEGGTISYKVSALGTTTTVELKKN